MRRMATEHSPKEPGHQRLRRLSPDGRLLRPRRVLIALRESLRGLLERRRIPGRLVGSDAGPIECLRSGIGLRKALYDLFETTLGVGPLLLVEGDAGASQHLLR